MPKDDRNTERRLVQWEQCYTVLTCDQRVVFHALLLGNLSGLGNILVINLLELFSTSRHLHRSGIGIN